LPFSVGQSRFKARESKRTSVELRAAADELATYLTSFSDVPVGPAAEPATLALAQFKLDRRFARHALAVERAQDVQRIPLHTFRNIGDLLFKGAKSALLSLVAALLKGGNVGGADTLTQMLKALLGS